jgi:hypothetical protein
MAAAGGGVGFSYVVGWWPVYCSSAASELGGSYWY